MFRAYNFREYILKISTDLIIKKIRRVNKNKISINRVDNMSR